MNKKIIAFAIAPIVILVATFLIGSFISTNAETSEFVITGSTLTKYNGQGGAVSIPENITVIGAAAFDGCDNLTSIKIPASVSTIGYRAFADCKGLVNLDIPSTVTTIEDSAFNGCSSLRSVNIGAGLSSLGNGVFAGCNSLANINFLTNPFFICTEGAVYNSKMTTLYQYLAGYPSNIYNMPSTVNEVKRYSFWGCEFLDEIVCSTGLNRIDDYAFANCKSLDNIVIYVPTRGIGIGAFLYDNGLRQITVPESVCAIQESAFEECPSDLIFVCDEGTYAYNYAVENGYLTSKSPQLVVKPRTFEVRSVSDGSVSGGDIEGEPEEPMYTTGPFGNTFQMSDHNIPEGNELDSTRIVSDKAFIDIAGLSVLTGTDYTPNVNTSENTREGFLPDYGYYNASLTSYDFPEGTLGIGMLTFARSSIMNVYIPEGVTEIGYGAFYHCDNLMDVDIPSSVQVIGAHAFDHTPWFDNWKNTADGNDFLIVGDGVLIGYKGQEEEPVIPDSVKYVSEGVF